MSLAAALLLHAAGLLALGLLRPLSTREPATVVELELEQPRELADRREATRGAPPETPAPEAPAPPVLPKRRAHEPGRPQTARRTDGTRPGSTAPGAPAAPGAPSPGLTLAMRGGVDLQPSQPYPRSPRAEADQGEGAPSESGSGPSGGGRSGSSESARTKERLDELLAQDRAVRNKEEGRAHPMLYQISRDAQDLFKPQWSLVENERLRRGSVGESTRTFFTSMAKAYRRAVEDYMRSPQDRAQDAEHEALRPRMLEGYAKIIRAAEKDASTISCDLCVDLRPGRDPVIATAQRSDRKPLDLQAREALLKAARIRPHPPDAEPVRACYRFSALFTRVPLLPMAGCSFDESALFIKGRRAIECFYPTMRVQKTDVKLLSVRELTKAKPRKGS